MNEVMQRNKKFIVIARKLLTNSPFVHAIARSLHFSKTKKAPLFFWTLFWMILAWFRSRLRRLRCSPDCRLCPLFPSV